MATAANSNPKQPEVSKTTAPSAPALPTIAKERGTETVASRNALKKAKREDKVNGIARERR